MTQMRVGIIGCGNISSAYLRLGPLFKALDMRAVADINMDAAKARASEFGVRADTVEDLLTADDIDVIVNLTIPAVHYEVTKRILESGKHAYTEKPIVLTLAEGEDLRRIATEKGLRVGSAPDTFLGGVHQQARAMLDEGKIGRVIGGTCHVMGHGMEAWHPNPDFFYQPGAGPILDIGPYYVTNLIQLLGPVKSVVSLATTTFAERTIGNGDRFGEKVPVDTPTNIHALLEFVNGATITLGASWDVWVHKHGHMELYGEDGTLFVPDPNFFGGALEIGDKDKVISDVAGWDHPFGRVNDDEGRANYRCAGLADMATAIAENRPHRCNIDLAVHAVDVMTSILKAGEERRFVEMATTCERPAALSPAEAGALLR
ncbi:Predicted dehydrogenase [Cognatiyoonia koreensis]|uniref:Predicted dehydrogenase n=1 Tax=Cognatiyoonia koreensis TaxID=364200 RepID=A0A1I0RWD1_9RHOB|nr:Gfo/Idh/MocA family oxidoreductase [Cognatiyoonia koreensis]SEW45688.1 Predicted dehydrogenase [Cognatiyoonia koreensis]